jgi:hypothetical protein
MLAGDGRDTVPKGVSLSTEKSLTLRGQTLGRVTLPFDSGARLHTCASRHQEARRKPLHTHKPTWLSVGSTSEGETTQEAEEDRRTRHGQGQRHRKSSLCNQVSVPCERDNKWYPPLHTPTPALWLPLTSSHGN